MSGFYNVKMLCLQYLLPLYLDRRWQASVMTVQHRRRCKVP
jgi:hypothetical protein